MDTLHLRLRYRRIMAFFTRAATSFVFWEIVLPRLGLRPLRVHGTCFAKFCAMISLVSCHHAAAENFR